MIPIETKQEKMWLHISEKEIVEVKKRIRLLWRMKGCSPVGLNISIQRLQSQN